MSSPMNDRMAHNIVDALLKDHNDRRGLRQVWDAIDTDVQAEIRAAWIAIVKSQLGPPHTWEGRRMSLNYNIARVFYDMPLTAGVAVVWAAGPPDGIGDFVGHYRVGAADGSRVLVVGHGQDTVMPMGWFDRSRVLVDYTDPLTRGHILAQVRHFYWVVRGRMAPQEIADGTAFNNPAELAMAWERRHR